MLFFSGMFYDSSVKTSDFLVKICYVFILIKTNRFDVQFFIFIPTKTFKTSIKRPKSSCFDFLIIGALDVLGTFSKEIKYFHESKCLCTEQGARQKRPFYTDKSAPDRNSPTRSVLLIIVRTLSHFLASIVAKHQKIEGTLW